MALAQIMWGEPENAVCLARRFPGISRVVLTLPNAGTPRNHHDFRWSDARAFAEWVSWDIVQPLTEIMGAAEVVLTGSDGRPGWRGLWAVVEHLENARLWRPGPEVEHGAVRSEIVGRFWGAPATSDAANWTLDVWGSTATATGSVSRRCGYLGVAPSEVSAAVLCAEIDAAGGLSLPPLAPEWLP